MSPLDVEVAFDISRLPARLPASPAERRLDAGFTHTRPSEPNGERHSHHRQVVTLVQFDSIRKPSPRPHGTRPDTGTNQQTSVQAPGRGVPTDPDSAHSPQKLAERPLGGVRQDKAHLKSVPSASVQPAPVTKVTLSQFTNNDVVRSQNVSGAMHKSGRISFWADLALQERLKAVALREGLSISATCAAFLRKSLQQDIDLEYSATLEPFIDRAITRNMRSLATRLSWLLVRVAFDAGQTRCLVTNILGRQKGVSDPVLKTLMDNSCRSAKANIMRRTPHISDLISSVEQWMTEDSRGECDQKTHD